MEVWEKGDYEVDTVNSEALVFSCTRTVVTVPDSVSRTSVCLLGGCRWRLGVAAFASLGVGAVLRAVCAQCHDTLSPSVVWVVFWRPFVSRPLRCDTIPPVLQGWPWHVHSDRADSGTAALQHAGFCSVGLVSNTPVAVVTWLEVLVPRLKVVPGGQ